MWPQGIYGGQLGPVLQIAGGTLGGCWLSHLCLVVWPLARGVPGAVDKVSPALPGSVELFFLHQASLGNTSPILSLSLLIPKWWRH